MQSKQSVLKPLDENFGIVEFIIICIHWKLIKKKGGKDKEMLMEPRNKIVFGFDFWNVL